MKGRNLPVIYPTASFGGLVFILGAIWYAGASQGNSAAYLLLFALTGVFLVSIPHTLMNLSGLRATAESVKPAFAGQEVSLPVEITNESRANRHAVVVSLPGWEKTHRRIETIGAGKAERAILRFAAQVRGEHEISALNLASIYPLGFLRSLRYLTTTQRYLVYPKPAGDPNLPIHRAHFSPGKTRSEMGEGDDFAGVRPYIPGESQRHIDWKAVARGQDLMTKQFAIEESDLFYIDFSQAKSGDLENKLSQLTLCVIEAERARKRYGLRLPALEIPPALGDAHFHRCLRALALFKS